MNAKSPLPPFYLGIDLGGTNVKGGVVDDQGCPLSSVTLPTNAEAGPVAGVETLAEVGRQAVQASGLNWDAIRAVGLGSPGTMDIQAGLLLEPSNLPGWENLPIRDRLAEKLKKQVIFQNDANAAAIGEYWAGAGRNVKSLVLFTLGTGIGGGIILDGKLIEGQHSHGAEYGHIVIQMDNGRLCSCGQTGHLEAYASVTALVKRAHEALDQEPESRLRAAYEQNDLTGKRISEEAAQGDPLARRLMRETARYLAVGAVSLMHTIDPDMILFGGGMIGAGETLLNDIKAGIQELAFPIPARHTIIRFAELGGDAGFIGAAGCARLHFKTSS